MIEDVKCLREILESDLADIRTDYRTSLLAMMFDDGLRIFIIDNSDYAIVDLRSLTSEVLRYVKRKLGLIQLEKKGNKFAVVEGLPPDRIFDIPEEVGLSEEDALDFKDFIIFNLNLFQITSTT